MNLAETKDSQTCQITTKNIYPKHGTVTEPAFLSNSTNGKTNTNTFGTRIGTTEQELEEAYVAQNGSRPNVKHVLDFPIGLSTSSLEQAVKETFQSYVHAKEPVSFKVDLSLVDLRSGSSKKFNEFCNQELRSNNGPPIRFKVFQLSEASFQLVILASSELMSPDAISQLGLELREQYDQISSRHFENGKQNGHLQGQDLAILDRFCRGKVVPRTNPKGLLGRFREQVLIRGDQVAILEDSAEITYNQLNSASNALAVEILGDPNEFVCILLPQSRSFIMSIIAVVMAGKAYVPLSTMYSLEQISGLLKDLGSPILLSTAGILKELGLVYKNVLLLDQEKYWNASNIIFEGPDPETKDSAVLYCICSSGTTGKSKPILVEHRSVLNFVDWMVSEFQIRPPDRSLLACSPAFDVSVSEIWPYLCSGARLCIPPEPYLFQMERMVGWIERQGITAISTTTAFVRRFLGSPQVSRLDALRFVVCIGEKVLSGPPAGLPFPVFNAYGPTEATVWCTLCRLDPGSGAVPPIGRPISNVDVYVLDSDLGLCLPEAVGEIWIGGAGLARGYYGMAELTGQKFRPNPYGLGRMYRTGDLGYWAGAGHLMYRQRMDDQVKVGGFRLELGEVEFALCRDPSIREAAVVLEDKDLVAYCVCESGKLVPALADLQGILQRHLPYYALPKSIYFLDSLPLSPVGKVCKRALAPLKQNAFLLSSEIIPLADDVEGNISKVWSELLRIPVEAISRDSNFFGLGGTSLGVPLVLHQLAKLVPRASNLSISTLFQHPTVAGFGAALKLVSEPGILRNGNRRQFPLSFQQEQIWLHEMELSEADRTVYNTHHVFELESVDVSLLKKALEILLNENEILRGKVLVEDGRAILGIYPHSNLDFEVVNLEKLGIYGSFENSDSAKQGLANDSCLHAVRLLEAAHIQSPFSLTKGPLIKFFLAISSIQKSRLCAVAHHIVMDGQSWLIFETKLRQVYGSLKGNSNPSRPADSIQYGDFAVWQNDKFHEDSEDMLQLEQYWKNKLLDFQPISLPNLSNTTTTTGPPKTVYKEFKLSQSLSSVVRELSRLQNTVPFVIFLAAFKVLLLRYTRQTNITVLSPMSGRTRTELEGVIGHFVNLVPIRSDLSGNPNFRDLVQTLHRTVVKGIEHQAYPFPKLLQTCCGGSDLVRKRLFNIVIQMIPGTSLGAEDLVHYTENSSKDCSTGFDFTIDFCDTGSQFCALISSRTGDRILENIMTQFIRFLQGVSEDSSQRINAIQILTLEEKGEILNLYSRSEVSKEPSECANLLSSFEAQVRLNPNKSAILEDVTTLSYAELNLMSEHYAACFQGSADDFVAILLPQSANFIAVMLGVLKAGKAYVPLNPLHTTKQLEFMLKEFGYPLLVTSEVLFKDSGLEYKHPYFVSDPLQLETKNWANRNQRSPDSIMYCIFTSGSTGRPKGVLVQESSVLNLVNWSIAEYEIMRSSRSVVFHSPAADASVGEMWPYLVSGACLCIPSNELRYDVEGLKAWVRHNGITHMDTTTEIGRLFLAGDCAGLNALRHFTLGGEKLVDNPLASGPLLPFAVYNAYGPTEATVTSTSCRLRPEMRIPPIGRPIAGTEVYILDETLQPIPLGAIGEIYIGGNGLAFGYHGNPVLTLEKFPPNPFAAAPGSRMYRTGDLGSWLPDRNLLYSARVDDQVKLRGFRVELSEIESALGRHALLAQAAVVLNQGILLAFCVLSNPELCPALEELTLLLQGYLPYYSIPRTFYLLDRLPLTPVGKVDKRALEGLKGSATRLEGSERSDPKSNTELAIGAAWSAVLNIPLQDIGTKDNFFALGGNSLKMTQVHSRLQSDLSMTIPFRVLFDYSTLEVLASRLEGRNSAILPQAIDFITESQLPPMQFDPCKSYIPTGAVLLTGATGYLGSNLLYELLIKTDHTVVCIVRGASDSAARERVLKSLANQSIVLGQEDGRLEVFAGDIGSTNLGLTVILYQDLSTRIEAVYHCAAEVNFFKNFHDLKHSNVNGTREILGFVSKGSYKVLHYVSTLGVCEETSEGSLLDTDTVPSQEGIGYSQSKYVAERMVWLAVRGGCPGIIYRVGTIGAHSQREAVNGKDFLAVLVRACKRVGTFPKISGTIQYSTLDFTLATILHFSLNFSKFLGRAFHVFQGNLSYSNFLSQIGSSEFPACSLQKWQALFQRSEGRDLDEAEFFLDQILPQASYSGSSFLEIEAGLNREYSATNLDWALEGAGFGRTLKPDDILRYSDLLCRQNKLT